MRKQLRRLTMAQLADMGRGFSLYSLDKEELIDKLVNYFADYGITWPDVKHRYQLNGDKE